MLIAGNPTSFRCLFALGNGCGYCGGDRTITTTVQIGEGRLAGTLKGADTDRAFDVTLVVAVVPDDHGAPCGRTKCARSSLGATNDGKAGAYMSCLARKHPTRFVRITKGWSNGKAAVVLFDCGSGVIRLTGEAILSSHRGTWRIDDELTDRVMKSGGGRRNGGLLFARREHWRARCVQTSSTRCVPGDTMRLTLPEAARSISLMVASALAATGAATTALADTVTLRNGDRITGSVVRKEAETLIFRTSYAGEIKITWADVAALQTDKPVEVQLEDGSNFAARLAADKSGVASIAGAPVAREQSLPLGRIAFINPTPEQSGKGVAYRRRVNLAANLVRGNTDSGRLVGEGEFVARAKMYRYRLWGQGTWASEGDATTESNWRTTGSYDWFVRPHQFIYGRMSFEQDEFRDIKLRSQFGGGYGYQFLDTADTELSVQAGPNFVRAIEYDGARRFVHRRGLGHPLRAVAVDAQGTGLLRPERLLEPANHVRYRDQHRHRPAHPTSPAA